MRVRLGLSVAEQIDDLEVVAMHTDNPTIRLGCERLIAKMREVAAA